jgi:NADH dehydrogenase FAD-containing subunit
VIYRKDFFEYSPNFLQNISKSTSGFKAIVFNLQSVVTDGRFIQAGLKLLKRHTVEVEPENAEETKERLLRMGWEVAQTSSTIVEISFDFCVVCIGSQYPAPIRSSLTHLNDRVAEVQKAFNTIFNEKIRHVIVCGGGFVGVEAACGIAKSRKVKVSLVHRGSEICKALSAKARTAINRKLKEHNVIVRLNEVAVQDDLQE